MILAIAAWLSWIQEPIDTPGLASQRRRNTLMTNALLDRLRNITARYQPARFGSGGGALLSSLYGN